MKSLLLLILLAYVLTLIYSAFIASIRFFIDVGKWHKMEKRAVIHSSIENYIEEGEKNGRKYNDRTGDNNGNEFSCGDNTGDNNGNEFSCGDDTGDRKPLDF